MTISEFFSFLDSVFVKVWDEILNLPVWVLFAISFFTFIPPDIDILDIILDIRCVLNPCQRRVKP